MVGKALRRNNDYSKEDYFAVSKWPAEALGREWTPQAQGQVVRKEVSNHHSWSLKAKKQSKF